jgi:5'-nucleotidase
MSNKSNKIRVFVDMDGVLVNFEKAFKEYLKTCGPTLHNMYQYNPDLIPGIFRDAEPMPGAIEAIQKLHRTGLYDLCVATTSPWDNQSAAADKMFWIQKYFGEEFYKSMIITHRKDMLNGDYLIDDRTVNGASEFDGMLIQFGTAQYPDWETILQKIFKIN